MNVDRIARELMFILTPRKEEPLMRRSHRQVTSRFIAVAALLVLELVVFTNSKAQQPVGPVSDRDRGIALYMQGDTKASSQALSAAVKADKHDGQAWYYLGLARLRENDTKNARKSFESAVKFLPNFAPAHIALSNSLLFTNRAKEAEKEARLALSLEPNSAEAHYLLGTIDFTRRSCEEGMVHAEAALKAAPGFSSAYLLKSQLLLCSFHASLRPIAAGSVFKTGASTTELTREEKLENSRKSAELFREAAENLEKFLTLAPNARDAALWREQLVNLKVYAEPAQRPEAERTVFTGLEVTVKARILAKPEPTYTSEARDAQIMGTVVLRAVFASDGTITNILVISPLPKGLTERAIQAARKIKFTPAQMNGRPVSMVFQLEYNFNLY